MESIDTLYLVVGIIAIGVGIYMLIAKKLIGRKEDVPEKLEPQFIKLDAITYIIEGIFSLVLGLGTKLPVLGSVAVQIIIIVLAIGVVAINFIIGKRIKA